MKIIIDIDENYYKAICKRAERFGRGSAILPPSERIIFNGILLPKGHGRLIDADTLYREIETEGWFDSDDEYYGGGLEDIVLNAPTIIEADRG